MSKNRANRKQSATSEDGTLNSWLYLIPAVVFVAMTWSPGEIFARVNIHKTFLLFTSVTVIFFVVDLWVRSYNRQRKITTQEPPIGWLLFLSLPILASLPGLVLHRGHYNWLLNHELSIHIMYMLWMAYFVRCVRNAEQLEKLMVAIGPTIIYVVWKGYQQKIGRPSSTFGNVNLYANFLILLLPIFLLLFLPIDLSDDAKKRFHWKKLGGKELYFLSIFLVGFFGLLHTQTRSAIAGFAQAILLLLIYLIFLKIREYYRIRGWIFAFAILGLPLLILAIAFAIVSQLDEAVIESSHILHTVTWKAWAARLMSWQMAMESIGDSFFFGFGAGSSYTLSFEYIAADSRLYHFYERSFKHVHCELLEVMQEGGLFGLVVQIVVLVVPLLIVMRLLRSAFLEGREKKMVLGIGLGLIGYNIHGIFSLATRMTQNEMTMYSLMAMLLIFYSKAKLPGRLSQFFAIKLPDKLPSPWLFLSLVVFAWWIQYPTFRGSHDFMMLLTQEKIKSVADVKRVTRQYEDSPSIYVLHFLANLLANAGQGKKMTPLLDRMEAMIPHYRDVDYLRFMEYQLTNKNNLEIGKLRNLAEIHQSKDRYDPRIILWLARIAAFENDHARFTEQIRYVSQLHAVDNKLLTVGEIENLTVAVTDLAEGAETHFRESKIELKLSRSMLDEMMQSAKRIFNEKKQLELYQTYLENNRIVVTAEEDVSDSIDKKRNAFSESLFEQLSTWSALPKLKI